MTPAELDALFGPLGLQILGGLAVGWGLLSLYRWIDRRHPLGASIFAAGFVLRASLGIVLFWISWLDLRVLRSMHQGNGFWSLAPDAQLYMEIASRAAVDGLDTITRGSPSPAYTTAVALWMRLVGISPLSGMYLNLAAYSVLCALLVALWRPRNEWRADLPLIVMLVAFSFSPVLVIHGSQSLKDDVFGFVIALGAVGVLFVVMPIVYGSRAIHAAWAIAAGTVGWLAAVYYAAGIRTYFAFFMLCSLAGVVALFSLRPRREVLLRHVPIGIAACVLSAMAYQAGAGPYDTYLRLVLEVVRRAPDSASQPVETAAGAPTTSQGEVSATSASPSEAAASADGSSEGAGLVAAALNRVNGARRGFTNSGGGTNIVVGGQSGTERSEFAPEDRAPRQRVRRAEALVPETVAGYLQRAAVGLATIFVPISLLQALSITNLTGGRGLLFVTDVDTLFIDLTLLATLALLYTRRDAVFRRLPYVAYLLMLGGGTAVLLAYVVTNFGTQFRLRMMAVVPLWLLLLATADRRFIPAAREEEVPVSRPAPAGTAG